MALTLQQKKETVRNLEENISRQKGLIFVDFCELKNEELSQLRKSLRENNCLLQVAKKTLLKLALKDKKSVVEMIDNFGGSVALIFGFQDQIKPAKIAYQFAQKHENLELLGGFWDGNIQGQEGVITLAKLPSYQELLGKFVNVISASPRGLVNVLNGNLKGLVVALSQIKQIK
jgi:large subunit ribosomal protein L10